MLPQSLLSSQPDHYPNVSSGPTHITLRVTLYEDNLVSKGAHKIAVPVVSLPVPAVVGIHTNGFNFAVTGSPLPMGAFTWLVVNSTIKGPTSIGSYEIQEICFRSTGVEINQLRRIHHATCGLFSFRIKPLVLCQKLTSAYSQ